MGVFMGSRLQAMLVMMIIKMPKEPLRVAALRV
jgi:hypothetical protein